MGPAHPRLRCRANQGTLLSDGTALYIGFDATQTKTPILANQATNNVGQDTDDEVQVNLWPAGQSGVMYQFISTPRGTRYQNSTENPNYEPTWEAAGHIVDSNHYTVTMRIPLNVMRGAQSGKWLVQLSRFEPTTGELYLYNGNANTNGTGDVTAARPFLGVPTVVARPQPRFATYALGAIASPAIGGNTSRVGVDFAIPISAGTSIVGTLHPDFSNVENDQQTISPTAFPRFLQETRPFFAQGSNNYNYMECDECLNVGNLYTPNIPTPQSGYAIEGREGNYAFGGFTAIGANRRNDNAQAITYHIPNKEFFSFQRVNVEMPGLSDTSEMFTTKWTDGRHKFVYGNFAQENGTNVTDMSKAKMAMVGGGWFGPNSFTGFNVERIGSQYNPYDGFVTFNDAAGYGAFHNNQWNPTGGRLRNAQVYGWIDRYHGTGGALNNTDQELGFRLTTRSTWHLEAQTGAAYALIGSTYMPLTQNQTTLAWHYGTATPSSLSFATGIFGGGRLNSWYRSTTFTVSRKVAVTLELDNTQQFIIGGPVNEQWLEKVGIQMQSGADSSFAIGLRRFVGTPPTPGSGCYGMCSNVSFNFHKRFGKRELYVAYGSASPLTTVPQFLVKLIDYIGADKGT